jgi:hypothetical protein
MTETQVQLTTIQAITGSIPKGYALLAGMQLGLFTALHDRPRTLDQLAAAIRCEPRRLSGLLFYLVRIGLLSVADRCFAFAAIGFHQRGLAHTESDVRRWLRDAGCDAIEFRWSAVPPGATAIIARKRT